MKYFYTGLAVLAVLLAASLWCNTLIAGSTEHALAALDDALAAFDAGDAETAAADAALAQAYWQEKSKFLSAVLSHEELDEIENAFTALDSYTKTQSDEEFRRSCAELLFRLRHITQRDVPFYYNFFTRVIGA